MKCIAIMQPYLFPYLGYYQLAASVDRFVFYDDVMFIKQGYINRNCILMNGIKTPFSLPIKDQSSYRAINLHIAIPPFDGALNSIMQAYKKAPHFEEIWPIVKEVLSGYETNIARLAERSVRIVFEYLDMPFDAVSSSSIARHQHLKAQDRVLSLCEYLGASNYVNAIGGTYLYDETAFSKRGIKLLFHRMREINYPQGNHPFVANLSIIDVLMHNAPDKVKRLLKEYDHISKQQALSLRPLNVSSKSFSGI